LKGGLLPHDHVGKHQERQNDVGGHVDTRRRHLEREKKRKEKKRRKEGMAGFSFFGNVTKLP